MISEDSDYTSDVGYPLQHPCYGVSSLDDPDFAPSCYPPNDVTYELAYPGHVVRQPAALIGRRFYDEDDDWRRFDENAGDLYRASMAYRCRLGTDWELAEPLSYNSRPARFIPCDRYSPNSTWLVMSRLDPTRHVRRVEPVHFGCVELVEQHGSTRSTRRARLTRHARLDALDMSNVSCRVET